MAAWESWTMSAKTRKFRRLRQKASDECWISPGKKEKTNGYVRGQVSTLDGPQEPLLAKIKRRKLTWFGHVTRHNTLPKTILQGTLEGGRKRGRQQKSWFVNIKEWNKMDSPTLLRSAENRACWQQLARKSSLMSPLRPQQSGE